MKSILLCRTQMVPTSQQVAETLRQAGYTAFVEVETGHPKSKVGAEIRYAPGRMPIVVRFYNDLYDNPDESDYDYFDWLEELVPDATAREGIRRFIFVDAMENVESKAFQTTIDFLRVQTNATVIVQEQPSKP